MKGSFLLGKYERSARSSREKGKKKKKRKERIRSSREGAHSLGSRFLLSGEIITLLHVAVLSYSKQHPRKEKEETKTYNQLYAFYSHGIPKRKQTEKKGKR